MDINCDMGEGFGHWRLGETDDAALMPHITSANIATGFHAGDPSLMDATVALAVKHGVAIGAHPGFADLRGFGRRRMNAAPEEMVNDILYQLGALREFASRHGGTIAHVKPHGALYMELAQNEAMSRLLVRALRKVAPAAHLFCMDISVTARIAREEGQPVVREFFADRDYDNTGAIVFARQVGRADPLAMAERVVRACREGVVRTVEGDDRPIAFESICFHSDTPGSLGIAQALKPALVAAGIAVGAP
ncbi:5-oxoprolinase subunit PxpA [Rhodovarius crocodyli]|uniref:5-oxoprolinase subunit PxpA n=1 Tax=Rhodovarius crocodyli TaxID=1979269 RepID=A0A437MEQ5_9PROT|nr:5-oxoprolinase subunit PxpA [Rhodovarius crocodyli]RVT96150.1 5-oxoprolinase subunit PxpA [Rhodovarius crocodyli]